MADLVAKSLSVSLAGRPVLHGIDTSFTPATLTVIVGPNGSGKSTLLRALAGLEAPSAGQASLGDGPALDRMPAAARARQIAWAPPALSMPFAYTAHEVVVMGRYPHHLGAPGARDRQIAGRCLAESGAAGLADRPVTALSSGERQRVQLARVLAAETPWVLLDEPGANLDIGAALGLCALLRRLARDGRGVIAVMHDLAMAYRYADRLLCLSEGRLAADGPPAATLTEPLARRIFGCGMRLAACEDGGTVPVFDRLAPP